MNNIIIVFVLWVSTSIALGAQLKRESLNDEFDLVTVTSQKDQEVLISASGDIVQHNCYPHQARLSLRPQDQNTLYAETNIIVPTMYCPLRVPQTIKVKSNAVPLKLASNKSLAIIVSKNFQLEISE